MATKKKSSKTSEYIYGDPVVTDSSTIDPSIGYEDNTKVLVGLKRVSDGTLYAVELEAYEESADYKDKTKFEATGAIIRNEDEWLDILVAPDEFNAYFTIEPTEEIPDGDPRRRNYTNPTFTQLDGKERTDRQIAQHKELTYDGCAVCKCIQYSENYGEYWLPSAGEYNYIVKNLEKVNDILNAIGGTEVEQIEYWTSTRFSEDHMWSYNLEDGGFHFWHSQNTEYGVRPITTSVNYILIED